MTVRRDLFDDFHLHGASAPEWNQRYVQLSPGKMRSALVEYSAPGLHVFRKWMSEQVVQQGGLPAGRICFALAPQHAEGLPRMQGREFHGDSLFVLRGGDDFTLHRPKGMELLAVTFDEDAFLRLLDEGPRPVQARTLLARRHLRVSASALQRMLRALDALAAAPGNAHGAAPWHVAFEAVRALVDGAAGEEQGLASAHAGFIVARCQAIVGRHGAEPPDIEALCRALKTSRRTLQNSFRQVADTTASDYLRCVRLHAVRRALLSTPRSHLGISQSALDQGFTHFGRFTAQYKALFHELPSATARPLHEPAGPAAAR
jgi:AraC family ethanolamine operon transcriptional activator